MICSDKQQSDQQLRQLSSFAKDENLEKKQDSQKNTMYKFCNSNRCQKTCIAVTLYNHQFGDQLFNL